MKIISYGGGLVMSIDKICVRKLNIRDKDIDTETDCSRFRCYDCDGYLYDCDNYVSSKKYKGVDKYGVEDDLL